MFTVTYTPSRDLLKAVRAALLLRDHSLTSWAAQAGVKRQNLTAALLGTWKGPKASALVERVTSEVLASR